MAYIKKVDTVAEVAEWLSEKVAKIAGHAIDTKRISMFEEVTQKGMFQIYSILSDAVKYLNAEHAARSVSYECETYPNNNQCDMKLELVIFLKDKSDSMINPFDVADAKIEAELRFV